MKIVAQVEGILIIRPRVFNLPARASVFKARLGIAKDKIGYQ